MNFTVRDLGNIAKEADEARLAFATATWLATKRAGEMMQKALREDVVASKIRRAPAMAKTWRMVMRPKTVDTSFRYAAIVFNRSRVFSEILANDRLSRPKNGGALLVPIGRAAKLKLPIGQPRTALVKFAQAEFGEMVIGKLKSGKLAIGVVKPAASGPKGGRGGRFEPLFLLLRETRGARRVDPEGVYARVNRQLSGVWLQILKQEYERRAAIGATQNVTNQDTRDSRRIGNPFGVSTAPAEGRGL
jgi:hypothetical protein